MAPSKRGFAKRSILACRTSRSHRRNVAPATPSRPAAAGAALLNWCCGYVMICGYFQEPHVRCMSAITESSRVVSRQLKGRSVWCPPVGKSSTRKVSGVRKIHTPARRKEQIDMTFTPRTLAAVAMSAALLPAVGHAQFKNEGYLLDQYSNIVTSSNTGLCWRTGAWTPARAVAQCDPDLVKKSEPAPAPAASKKEAAPPVKQQAQPAPKKPEAAPAKPAPQKINFAADALFDFNKSEVRPRGKAMLDDLVSALKGATYEVILAIGHTDRIGSVKYNQKLSVKRAEAVKQYLVDKGIAANRIYAEGKGKSQPVTKPGDCKGRKSSALIACLQPDRRVDVEVTGTK
jgi:OOP family OmpA-OmpF porin